MASRRAHGRAPTTFRSSAKACAAHLAKLLQDAAHLPQVPGAE